MSDIIKKQLEKVEKQEQKYLNQKENALQKKKKAFSHTLEQKIPLKLRKSIQNAFYKGFLVIFEKGTDVIEKTYDKEKILWEYQFQDKKFCENKKENNLKN